MIKDNIQASINMCLALEIKHKVKLTGVIDTIKQAITEIETMKAKVKRMNELDDKYINHNKSYTADDDIEYIKLEHELKEWSERE